MVCLLWIYIELLEDIAHGHTHGAINDYAQRAISSVFTQQGDSTREIGIRQRWHGDQKLVGERGVRAHWRLLYHALVVVCDRIDCSG